MNPVVQRLIDVVLVGALAIGGGLEASGGAPGGYPASVDVTFAVLVSLPLLARRRHPAAAMVAIVVLVAVWIPGWGIDHQGPGAGWFALVVAYYSVGAHTDDRRSDMVALATLGLFAVLTAAQVAAGYRASDQVVAMVILVLVWLAGRTIRRRGIVADMLLRERDERLKLAAADERTRIARELHDVVTHNVTVMVVEASAERRRNRVDDEAADSLASIERVGRETLSELRRVLGVLRAPGSPQDRAPQPTLAELEPLVERVRAGGLDVRLLVDGTPVPLPPGLDLTAYRLVQEALTNVVKHARGAGRADVTVSYGPAELELRVCDDGTEAHVNGEGHGLIGMRERVEMVGGVFTAAPRPEGGFEVHATLPLEPAP